MARDQQEEKEEEDVQFYLDPDGDPTAQQELQREEERRLEMEREGFIPLVPDGPLLTQQWEESSNEDSSDYDSDEQLAIGPAFGRRFAR